MFSSSNTPSVQVIRRNLKLFPRHSNKSMNCNRAASERCLIGRASGPSGCSTDTSYSDLSADSSLTWFSACSSFTQNCLERSCAKDSILQMSASSNVSNATWKICFEVSFPTWSFYPRALFAYAFVPAFSSTNRCLPVLLGWSHWLFNSSWFLCNHGCNALASTFDPGTQGEHFVHLLNSHAFIHW